MRLRAIPGTLVMVLIVSASAFGEPQWVKDAAREGATATAPVEATAIGLRYVNDIIISSSGNARTTIEQAYKLLTKSGLSYGSIELEISPSTEVKDLKGWVIKPDGSVKSLTKEEVYTQGLQQAGSYYDIKEMIAKPFHAQPGDIVAFEAEVEEQGWSAFHQDFTFQTQEPVRFAQVSVHVPDGWQIVYGGWRTEGIEFQQQGNRYTWTAHDLQYQPDEPLSPSWHYLARRVAVSCFDPMNQGKQQDQEKATFADWRSLAKYYAGKYLQPCAVTDEITQKWGELGANKATLDEKLGAIADFVQNDIRYVAVEIGKGGEEPRPAATTLRNRYGDCKDKSTLMRSLLEAAGISSVAVLANPVYPVDPRVPNPFQFNHVIVGIPAAGLEMSPVLRDAVVGDWLFFDPTDVTTRLGQIPWVLQGTRVLACTDADSVLVTLPYPKPEDLRRVSSAKAWLNEDGSFFANVTITDFGGLAAATRYERKVTPEKDQIDEWTRTLSAAVPSVGISDYKTGEAGDSVWVTFLLKGASYVQDTGGLLLLRPDIFKAPTLPRLTAKERKFPVAFGPPLEVVTHVDWGLPHGWSAEADTATIKNECEAASIYSKITSGGTLGIQTAACQTGRLMSPDDYEAARDFSKAVSQVRGQVVMIHKK